MFKKLVSLLAPFYTIAQELTAIRELYEAELAARDKPIFRITESPSESDTVVMWGEKDNKDKSGLRKLLGVFDAEDAGDEDLL